MIMVEVIVLPLQKIKLVFGAIKVKFSIRNMSIRKTMAWSMVILCIVITLSFVLLNFIFTSGKFITIIYGNYNDLLIKQFEFIEYWLERRLENITNVASHEKVNVFFVNRNKNEIDDYINKQMQSGFFYEILLFNTKKEIIYSRNATIANTFENFMKKSTYLKDLHIYPVYQIYANNEKKAILPVSSPIFDNNNNIKGFIVALIDISFIKDSMEIINTGEDGGAYILDGNGRVIISTKHIPKSTFISDYYFIEHNEESLYLVSPKTNQLTYSVQQCIKTHHHGKGEYLNHENKQVIGIWKWYSYPQWMLLIEIKKSEALRPIIESSIIFFTIGTILLSLTIYLSIVISRYFSKKLSNFVNLFIKASQGELLGNYPLVHNDTFTVMKKIGNSYQEYDKREGMCFINIGLMDEKISKNALCQYIVEKKFKTCIECYIYKLYQNNEIDILGAWFNILINNLKDIIKNILDIMSTLSNTSDELTKAASDFSDSANALASSNEEILATVEQLSASFDGIYNKADHQSQTVDDLMHIMQQFNIAIENLGTKILTAHKSVESINAKSLEGKTKLTTLKQSLVSLHESSSKIEEIVQLIDDLSDKINLLSLNASIEAARAGEAGRGFAVVAEEISKLADQTAVSVKNISETIQSNITQLSHWNILINDILEYITTTIDWLRQFSHLMDDIKLITDKERENKNNILSSVMAINEKSNDIKSSIYEQKTAAEEIVKSTSSISVATQELAARSQQLAANAESLRDNAIILENKIRYFTTG